MQAFYTYNTTTQQPLLLHRTNSAGIRIPVAYEKAPGYTRVIVPIQLSSHRNLTHYNKHRRHWMKTKNLNSEDAVWEKQRGITLDRQ